ncbi:MAG: 3-dehydroquinate synthase [Firmicutes bacterium]|nr:3-dehydroquinate synthase [Bacillota bacterium]
MRVLNVKLSNEKYNIYIKRGLISDIGREIRGIYKGEKIAVITDSNVQRIYGESFCLNLKKYGYKVKIITIKPGEESKSLEVAKNLYDKLLDFQISRGDLIITLGGGVVGDLGGFVSSTLFRGISFIQIPTTLLAQIDSSIGGKVAVNLNRGKNLIGSFYHPKAVFIDPNVLKTLDKRFLYDGMAEAIKYSLISDKSLFERLNIYKDEKELMYNIEDIIYNCCKIKKRIVELDERDKNERMLLNFGHTIGHAIEKYFNYKNFTHGEGVAIGMYNITKKSEEMNITQKGTSDLIKKVLKNYNLPYKLNNMEKEKILKAITLDKKNIGKIINIILLEKIGEGFVKKISKEEMKEFIDTKGVV